MHSKLNPSTVPAEMKNLVNNPDFAPIQHKLDKEIGRELARIGEPEIKPRKYYLKKNGYFGKKEFRKSDHIDNVQDVHQPISPNHTYRIEN